jgi:hypothetical protein
MTHEVRSVQSLPMGERVRLVESFDGVRAGAEGQVAGYYRRIAGELIAVLFDNGRSVPVPVGKVRTLTETSLDPTPQRLPRM